MPTTFRIAFLLALLASVPPRPAQATVSLVGSSAQTSVQAMSGVFDPSFLQPRSENATQPLADFASDQQASPGGPFPASAHATQTSHVISDGSSLSVEAEGFAEARAPLVPDPPLSNLFANATSSLFIAVNATQRTTFAISAQVSGPTAGDPAAFIDCSGDIHREGSSVSLNVTLESGGVCNLSLFLNIQRNGNLDFLLPGSASGTFHASFVATELAAQDGDTFRWVGGSSGAFDDAENWDPQQVPTFVEGVRSDTGSFEGGGTVSVDLAGGARGPAGRRMGELAQNGTRDLHPVGGTLILDDLDPTLTERSLRVGRGALRLDAGGVTARHAIVGLGGDGELEVVGPDGFFTTLGRFGVGGDGGGNVVIRHAVVTSAETVLGELDGQGSADVQDSGSLWQTGNLAVGFASDAALTIEGGARVESADAFVDCATGSCVGLAEGEKASVLVAGAAGATPSTWSVDGVLGIGPRGKVSIESGGALTGVGSGPTIRVGTSGSEADCIGGKACLEIVDGSVESTSIEVGAGGAGKLRIGPAGRVGAFAGVGVASSALSRGELELVGPSAEDQLQSAGVALIGSDIGAHGELVLRSGARASIAGGSVGSAGPGSFGLIELNGDAAAPDATVLTTTGDLVLGDDAAEDLFAPTGELALSNARLELNDADLDIRRTGAVTGSGRVDQFGVSFVTNHGVVGCGIQFSGSFTQSEDGVTECLQPIAPAPQLNPLDATRFARGLRRRPTPALPPSGPLVVSGDATLGGTLVLQFLNGAAPRAGDALDLIEIAGSVTGAFAEVRIRGLAPGADFATDFSGGKLVLTSLTDAVALPSVSVRAKPTLKESKKKGAKLKLTRSGDTSAALLVAYALGGTAENGFDYERLPGTIEIPAGKKTAQIALKPAADGVSEGAETIDLQLLPGDDYAPGLVSRVRIVLEDAKPKKRRQR
jgi:T5SS/PEP-CTERM-associated repeat protein